MTVHRVILLTGAFAIEAALLTLAHWQYTRYNQRTLEQTVRAAALQAQLTGTPLSYAFLTNQPNPNGSEGAGRRLITVLQTQQGAQIADLGWQPNPPVPTAAPDFTSYPKTELTITGITLPLPMRRGWLQGPLTTTHPQLLAFLAPVALTSQSTGPTYIAATQTSPTLHNITSAPPLIKSPATHASYALQWLAMALLFPLMCYNLNRRSQKSR